MSLPHYKKDETTHNTYHVRKSDFSMLQQSILLSDWLDLARFCVVTSASCNMLQTSACNNSRFCYLILAVFCVVHVSIHHQSCF